MEPSNRRFFWQMTALVIIIVLAFTAIYLWRNRSNDTSQPFVPTPTVTYPSGQPDTAGLWIDGWSYKITEGHPVQGVDGSVTEPKAVTFIPATDADVEALSKRSPEVLTQVAARMISADPKLNCTSEGCTTSTGSFPLSWFTHPDQIPDLGPVYQGWGVTSLLYHTPISISNDDVASVEVSADGYESYFFEVFKPSPARCDESGCGQATPPTTDLVISAAFGQLFSPWAAWLDEPSLDYFPTTTIAAAEPREIPTDLLDPPTGINGLSEPTDTTSRFDTSALTYFSSPTTGCPGFICTPAAVSTVVNNNTLTQVPMCPTDPEAGQQGFTTLVVQDLGLQVPLTNATAQFGLGGGSEQKSGDYTWTSGRTPVSGDQSMRMVRYWLFDVDDAPVALTALSAPADVAAGFDPLNLDTLNAIDPSWMVCPTPEPAVTTPAQPTTAASAEPVS